MNLPNTKLSLPALTEKDKTDAVFAIKNNFDVKLEKKFGEYWWISPIFAHIIINEIINHDIKLFNQQNCINKLLRINHIFIV